MLLDILDLCFYLHVACKKEIITLDPFETEVHVFRTRLNI